MDAHGSLEKTQIVRGQHLLLRQDAVLEILDEQLIDVLLRRDPIFAIDSRDVTGSLERMQTANGPAPRQIVLRDLDAVRFMTLDQCRTKVDGLENALNSTLRMIALDLKAMTDIHDVIGLPPIRMTLIVRKYGQLNNQQVLPHLDVALELPNEHRNDALKRTMK